MERSRALLFPVYLEIFELQKFVELEPQQVGNFWEISWKSKGNHSILYNIPLNSLYQFCPSGAERDFFWLNWSPWCFYRIPSGFLLRPDKIKSNGVTAFDFWFFGFFSRKIMIFVKICVMGPSKTSNITFGWLLRDPWHKYHDFPRKKNKKIENRKPSRHWILFYLAVGENPKGFDKNIKEINSIKKKYFQLINHAIWLRKPYFIAFWRDFASYLHIGRVPGCEWNALSGQPRLQSRSQWDSFQAR